MASIATQRALLKPLKANGSKDSDNVNDGSAASNDKENRPNANDSKTDGVRATRPDNMPWHTHTDKRPVGLAMGAVISNRRALT